MAANLAYSAKERVVDASDYKGIELEVKYVGDEPRENFNVHLKNDACERPFSSYRATFTAPANEWVTVQIPWVDFKGHGPGAAGTPLDATTLARVGLVAIGKEMQVELALSGMRFCRTGPVTM